MECIVKVILMSEPSVRNLSVTMSYSHRTVHCIIVSLGGLEINVYEAKTSTEMNLFITHASIYTAKSTSMMVGTFPIWRSFEDVCGGGGLKSNMHVGNFPWPFLDKTWCNIKQLLLVFKCYCLSFVNTKWFHYWNSDEPCAYLNFWSDCAFLLLVLNY